MMKDAVWKIELFLVCGEWKFFEHRQWYSFSKKVEIYSNVNVNVFYSIQSIRVWYNVNTVLRLIHLKNIHLFFFFVINLGITKQGYKFCALYFILFI